jgi:cell division protein ZapA
MPDLKVLIGGRDFNISCNSGEEDAVKESANLLSQEAELVNGQLGRLPEDKMLLLSGLLLGDKIRALKNEKNVLEAKLRALQSKLTEAHSKPYDASEVHEKVPLALSDENLAHKTVRKELEALQNVSELLDDFMKNVNIQYHKSEPDIETFPSQDSDQKSFL